MESEVSVSCAGKIPIDSFCNQSKLDPQPNHVKKTLDRGHGCWEPEPPRADRLQNTGWHSCTQWLCLILLKLSLRHEWIQGAEGTATVLRPAEIPYRESCMLYSAENCAVRVLILLTLEGDPGSGAHFTAFFTVFRPSSFKDANSYLTLLFGCSSLQTLIMIWRNWIRYFPIWFMKHLFHTNTSGSGGPRGGPRGVPL